MLKGQLMEIITKYFPDLSGFQQQQLAQLRPLYTEWNAKINVISRKDLSELYVRHVLHSMAIGKFIQFKPDTVVLDVGTGGGFPGIPLAILFPEARFHLVDSIRKKIGVVDEIAGAIGLKNVTTEHIRAEQLQDRYHFVVSRAVTTMPKFVKWVRDLISTEQFNDLPNGILYLKGGELTEELSSFDRVNMFELGHIFTEPFFETKKLVHLVP